MTFIDTADNYGESEVQLGEVLLGRRQQVCLATKFGRTWPGTATRPQIRASVEASLRRLQTDYIDLLYLHHFDTLTPLAETLGALNELVLEGKVRCVGSSNFDAHQIAQAESTARVERTERFVAAQNEFNLFNRSIEQALLPTCIAKGIGVVASRPLAHGFLTGKYRRGQPPPQNTRLADRGIAMADKDFHVIDRLTEFAARRDATLLNVSIGYLLAHAGVVSVVVGATHPSQVRANALAGTWEPSPTDVAALTELLRGAG
jgi:aryl-alcohol dehydrogenase-like predicted oxidoreductase